MRKKLLSLLAVLAAGTSMSLQASPVVFNFDDKTPVDNCVCTYAKDMESNGTTYSQMQPVAGWEFGVENGDAKAAAVFAYGSEAWLAASGNVPPIAGPEDKAGNALGICAVWSGTVQYVKEITLPAGVYTLTADVYNVGGTGSVNNNLIGFNGKYCAQKTFAVGEWSKCSVQFVLAEETTGNLSVGYVAADAGSGSMPKLFVNSITIEESVINDDTDVTNMFITNPNYTSNLNGWTAEGWGHQGNNEFPNKPYAEKWARSPADVVGADIFQTIYVPAGVYEISARIVGRDLKTELYVRNGEKVVASAEYQNVIKEVKGFEFEMAEGANVVIGYKAVAIADDYTAGDGWIAIDDWKLVYKRVYVDPAEFEAYLAEKKAELTATVDAVIATTDNAVAITRLNALKTTIAAVTDEEGLDNAKAVLASIEKYISNCVTYGGATLENPITLTIGAWKEDGHYQNFCKTFYAKDKVTDGVITDYTGQFTETWNGSAIAGRRFYQVMEEMPDGIYTIEAMLFANKSDAVYMYVGDGKSDKLTYGEGEQNVKFMMAVGDVTDYTLEFGIAQDEAISNWMAFSNLKVMYYGAEATKEQVLIEKNPDLTELENAIAAAEAHVLGFAAGEFAPYNNVAGVVALNEAKAATGLTGSQAAALVEKLNAAVWTVNDTEVNAVYNGADFSKANAGWNGGETWTVAPGTENYEALGALIPTDGNRTALYLSWEKNSGAWYNYGKTEGYTMPVKAGVEYVMVCDFAAWGVAGTPNIDFYDGADKLTRTSIASERIDNGGVVYTHVNMTIVPTVDGNGHISFWMPGDDNKGNLVISNIIFTTAENAKATGFYAYNAGFDESVGQLAKVEYTAEKATFAREFAEGVWNTICLPFEVEVSAFGEDAKAGELIEGDDEALMFQMVETLEAGKPYIIKNANNTVTVENATVVPTAAATTAGAYTMTGVFTPGVVPADCYFIYNNAFWHTNEKEFEIPAFRAYIEKIGAVEAPQMRIVFDGEESGISAIENDAVENGAMYNVMGQKVDNNYKGFVIKNGKKTINK